MQTSYPKPGTPLRSSLTQWQIGVVQQLDTLSRRHIRDEFMD